MNPRWLILETAARFRECGIPDPVCDSALLLGSVLRRPALELRLDESTQLSPEDQAAFSLLAERRLRREPLQYILREAFFFGRPFRVDSRVLIPRPETELLCEWVLEETPDDASPRVLDLCCGSGCIGITFRLERPRAAVVLTDLSPEALAVARQNASALGADVTLLPGDLFEPVEERIFDIILSNPPYIPAAECSSLQEEVLREPRMALDGGEDGLDFYRRIIAEAPARLSPGGQLYLELGMGEDQAVRRLMEQHLFTEIGIRKDYSGIPRIIRGRRPHV